MVGWRSLSGHTHQNDALEESREKEEREEREIEGLVENEAERRWGNGEECL